MISWQTRKTFGGVGRKSQQVSVAPCAKAGGTDSYVNSAPCSSASEICICNHQAIYFFLFFTCGSHIMMQKNPDMTKHSVSHTQRYRINCLNSARDLCRPGTGL